MIVILIKNKKRVARTRKVVAIVGNKERLNIAKLTKNDGEEHWESFDREHWDSFEIIDDDV